MLQRLARNVWVHKHTSIPSLRECSFLTYLNTSSSTMVTIRTMNVLILLCKWKWFLGSKRGSILSFLFFSFSATEDVCCISKIFHYRLLWQVSSTTEKKSLKDYFHGNSCKCFLTWDSIITDYHGNALQKHFTSTNNNVLDYFFSL